MKPEPSLQVLHDITTIKSKGKKFDPKENQNQHKHRR